MLSEQARLIGQDFQVAGTTFVGNRNRYAGGPRPIHLAILYESGRLAEYAQLTDEELDPLAKELAPIFRNFHPRLPDGISDSEIQEVVLKELTDLRKSTRCILEQKCTIIINDLGLTII